MWPTLRRGWSRWAARPALVPERGAPVPYRQLDRLVGLAADRLARAAVGPGTVVAPIIPSRPDLVITVLAALSLGATVAPANTRFWPRELRAALEATTPGLIVTVAELVPLLADLAPVVVLGRNGAEPDGQPSGWVGVARADLPRAERCGDGEPDRDAGLACFTTGAWAEPRAVLFTAEQQHGWLTPDPVGGGSVLLADDAATAAGWRVVLGTLATGGCVHLLERWAPARVARRLARGGVDRVWATGPQLNQLAALAAPARQAIWPPLTRIDAVGGILHQRAARVLGRCCDALVAAGLTVTEAGGLASGRGPTPASLHHPLDVGCPRPGVELEVRRSDGEAAAVGEVGEVHLAGAALGRPLRAPAFGAATRGALPTGDLGRADADGRLHLLGRRSDRFTCDGAEVVPSLVELALAGHPAVADVAVVPRPDPELGAVPVAVIVPSDPESPPFLADLADRLAELPPAWRPRAEAVVDRLPLSASGQLHRRMLAYDEAAR